MRVHQQHQRHFCWWHCGPSSYRLNVRSRPLSGKPGPKSRPSVAKFYRLGFLLFLFPLLYPDMQHWLGEGGDLAMQVTEVPFEFSSVSTKGTKQHGRRPSMCVSTSARLDTVCKGRNQVVKSSIQRAFRRSLQSGFAWYRGKHYSSADFEAMGHGVSTTS